MINKLSVRIGFEKDNFDWLWFLYVGSKHYKTFVIYLFIFQIDIDIVYKDWMIETKHIIDGKPYTAYTKNPKYINEKTKFFLFPIPKRKS